jgi:hypothetical protein
LLVRDTSRNDLLHKSKKYGEFPSCVSQRLSTE